jgi:hypothetical protein
VKKNLPDLKKIKVILLAVFITLFFIVLYLACFDSKTSNNLISSEQDNLKVTNNFTKNEQDNLENEIENKSSAIRFNSSDLFIINKNQAMIIVFNLKILSAPMIDKRIKFLSKYNSFDAPYVGWAIGLTKLESSTRFEIYLQDLTLKGGWIPLNAVNMNLNTNYLITFIIKPGEFVSGLMLELDENNKKRKDTKIIKLGGIPIPDLIDFSNNSSLQIASGKLNQYKFDSILKDVSIFKIDELPQRDQLEKIINKGFDEFFVNFKEKCLISTSDKKSSCSIN